MPSPQILAQPLGSDRDYLLTLEDDASNVVSTFGGSDALTAQVWSGLDQAVLATPAVAWVSPATGTVKLTVAASDTASLTPGMYRLKAWVTHAGRTLVFFDGSIELTATPGTAAALAVYGSFNDVLLYAPEIRQLADQREDLAGFAGERARARAWFEEAVLDRYRPVPGRSMRYTDVTGLYAGPYPNFAPGPGGRAAPTADDLRASFAAGGLRLTKKILEANARYAAAIVYSNQPGRQNPYHERGQQEQAMALALFDGCVVELDTSSPLDGVYEVRVDQDVTWLV